MRAAAQSGRIETGFRQHRFDAGNMPRFAAMGRASKRQRFVPQSVAIRRSPLDERQRLQRLDRGTREYRRRHVADRERHRSGRIGDRNGAAMPAFDQRTSRDFDQNGIGHVPVLRFMAFSISNEIE
jgi:hypothetical protein